MFWVVQYKYSTDNLAALREKYNLSVCYRDKFTFLKYQKQISQNLSNRITYRSNFLHSYKQLKRYYIARLKKLFLNSLYTTKYLYNYTPETKDISFFLNIYRQYVSLNCLDRALVWRASQINSIFKISYTEKKKKKIFLSIQN